MCLVFFHSYTHISTSLFTILPESDTKKIFQSFQKTKNSHTLLVAVKGFDSHSLEKMKDIEIQLNTLSSVTLKTYYVNESLQQHQEMYRLFMKDINHTKYNIFSTSKVLKEFYTKMTSSFLPIAIDKSDPFKILQDYNHKNIDMKNTHLVMEGYGYISYFTLHSESLQTHEKVYKEIHAILSLREHIQFFSPLFYFVENSNAIRADVHNIMYIALIVLLILYFIILRDMVLLIHTFITLATSAIIATIIVTQMYAYVSVFVFVFGISISTVAIDYMFHHYLHDHYSQKKVLNKEVLFGFLTTFFSFFILSFTSFLLIKQISLFAMISLLVSYLLFTFLYPQMFFSPTKTNFRKKSMTFCYISSYTVLGISIFLIIASTFWLHFDFNLKNLDYDNRVLKSKENFFTTKLADAKKLPIVIQGKSIDTLIENSKILKREFSSVNVPIASLLSKKSYSKNKDLFKTFLNKHSDINKEAQKLGFRKGYFDKAYDINKSFVKYSEEQIKNYGIEIIKVSDYYVSFGSINEKEYQNILRYDFVQSVSIKTYFENVLQDSMNELKFLGMIVAAMIVAVLLIFAQRRILYALTFLVFPIAMMSLYALFKPINILHIFMLFIILAIGIDYAIYMVSNNDIKTKKAISYSLVSTFAGFGILIFSDINVLFSLGSVATIGIISIYVLLICMKRE